MLSRDKKIIKNYILLPDRFKCDIICKRERGSEFNKSSQYITNTLINRRAYENQ